MKGGIPEIPGLLRGEIDSAVCWTAEVNGRRLLTWLLVAVVGSAAFGASIGWWRAPEQAIYTAIKFPVVILLTVFGNSILNAMLAPLLGVDIGLRQSFLAIMMSFTIAAAILGAVSPLMVFLIWNTPPLHLAKSAGSAHAFILLSIVLVIALGGVAANLRLFQLLKKLGGNRRNALRVLFAWLAGNLFLGSQMSWIFRPFIGSPGLPVQFLRDDAWKGSFFESVIHAVRRLL
jgi:hypothetical protein